MFNDIVRLSKHSIIYGLGVAASQFLGFVLIPLYTHYLTPEDYGTLEIFNVTLSILGVIILMGLTSALFRSYYQNDDPDNKKVVVSTAFLFFSIVSAITIIVLIALSKYISSALFDSDEFTFYFQILFLTLFFDRGMTIGLSYLRAREQPTHYALFTLARFIIGAGLNIYFVAFLEKGVLGILESNLIASAVVYAVLIVRLVKDVRFRFSSRELKKMLAFGLPLIPTGLAVWILTMADRYFLQFLSTPDELGLYSLGYKYGLVIQVILVEPFQLAWLPFMFSTTSRENAKEIYSRVFTYFLFVIMFVALVISVLSKEIVAVMSPSSFVEAYKIVPFVALSYVLFGCYYALMVGINLKGKTKYLIPIVLFACILNLGLNYLLVPDHGKMGAAIATLICYALLPIGCYFVSRRLYRVDYEWGRVVKIVLVTAVIYTGTVFISHDSGYVEGVFKILTLLMYPVVLYIIGFYRPEELEKAKDFVRHAPRYIRNLIVK